MYIFTYYFILAFAFNYNVLAQTDIEVENATDITSTTTYSTSSTVKPTPNICEYYITC